MLKKNKQKQKTILFGGQPVPPIVGIFLGKEQLITRDLGRGMPWVCELSSPQLESLYLSLYLGTVFCAMLLETSPLPKDHRNCRDTPVLICLSCIAFPPKL